MKLKIIACVIFGASTFCVQSASLYTTDTSKVNLNGTTYVGYLKTSENRNISQQSQYYNDSYFRLGIQAASSLTDAIIAFSEIETETDISDSFDSDNFDMRLGYAGLMFDEYGTITFGKQYLSRYLVTGWTDTGISRITENEVTNAQPRQSNVLKYRGDFLDRLTIGVDYTLEHNSDFNDQLSGYNYAFTYDINENISIGSTIGQRSEHTVGQEGSKKRNYIGGVKFENNGFTASAIYDITHEKRASQGDHEAMEVSVGYNINRYRFVTRFLKRNADIDEMDIETLTFGLSYKLNKHFDLMTEFSSSIQNHDYNSFTLAASYKF